MVRFDIDDGERTEHWYLQIRKGDVTVSHDGPEADCVISADIATFDAILTGRMNAMAAVLRGAVDDRGQGRPADGAAAALPRDDRGAGQTSGRLREEGSHERRRSRSSTATRSSSATTRRHRGVADRPDRAVLLRHPVPLEVGAHRQRPAAQPAVGRRPAVLRDPVLPGAGHRDRLHRRQAVGHPPARRRRRLPRGAHDPQPRREGRSTWRCASRRPPTSPTCSRSRTP